MNSHTDQQDGALLVATPTANGGSGAPRTLEPGRRTASPARLVCHCGCGETSPLMLVEGTWCWLGHLPRTRRRARR